MTSCPPEATLRLIGTEDIGAATFAGLEAHVEHCADCQKILEAATEVRPKVSCPTPALPGLVIERELGRGGASVVYLAWEPALKRHVAVKILPRNALVNPHAREHWLSEARALSRVPHDRVVAIHRVDENEDWLWLVLEYVPGGTLKERLTEPLTARDAARLMETIARTVGYFHTRGVSHLDLKPSNILLDDEPGIPWEKVSPKISDFGIARLEGEPGTTQTGAGGPKGTPAYMAPEQAAAVPGTIGPPADIHALGALLYHLLTGRPPYQGASSAYTLEQVRHQDPVPPRQLNGRVPRDLDTICLKCLEKAPSRRYETADALASDLRLWLDGCPIKARRLSPMGHAWRLARRYPAIAGLLLTLAITIGTGVAGLSVLLRQAEAAWRQADAEKRKAEAERVQSVSASRIAQAHEKFAATATDQIIVFLRGVVPFHRSTTPEQIEAALMKLWNSIDDLKSRGIVELSTLGVFEEEVAWALIECGKRGEARDLMNQAAADLSKSFAKDPADAKVQYFLRHSLLHCGNLVEDDQPSAALNYYEQAVQVEWPLGDTDPDYWLLKVLYMRCRFLASQFRQSGQEIERERSRHLGKRILERLGGSEINDLKDLSSPAPELVDRLFKGYFLQTLLSHKDKGTRDAYQEIGAEWIGLSVRLLSPFHSPSAAAAFDRDPEAGAVALTSAIRDRCSKLCLPDSMVPETVVNLWDGEAFTTASEHRRLGRIDEARATAARLMALAGHLVDEYPKSAHSYRLLSEAYSQIKKNAFYTHDDQFARESFIKAIDAARHSLALDSERPEAKRHLDSLLQKFATHEAERVKTGSTSP